MHLIILFIQLILLVSCEKKTEESVSKLSSLEKKIIKIAKKGNVPSLSVYIKTDNDALKFDYHHPDTKAQTLYGIGSTTKIFSAVFLFKLLEEGKLNLEYSVIDYVPTLSSIAEGGSITIGSLLNHTSGLSDYTMHPDWRKRVVNGDGPMDFDTKFGYIEPVLRNRGRYRYSNSNYLVLQEVVEEIFSKSYTEAIQDFFEKNGLSNLEMGHPGSDLQAFYAENDNASSNVSSWQENYGYDGGIYSTVDGLNEFLEKLFITKSILKEETLSVMMEWMSMNPLSITVGKGKINEYGYGIMKLAYKGKEYLGHAGGTLKYQSFMFYNPEDKVAISIITNSSGKHYNAVFFQEIIPAILDNL